MEQTVDLQAKATVGSKGEAEGEGILILNDTNIFFFSFSYSLKITVRRRDWYVNYNDKIPGLGEALSNMIGNFPVQVSNPFRLNL